MSNCDRPIDPLDAGALAAGGAGVFAADAAEHARQCPSCGDRVAEASRLAQSLESVIVEESGAEIPDLAERVVRLRSFSRRERRDFAVWRGACGLCVALFFAGLLLLTLPGLTVGEQAGLGLAAVAPVLILAKTLVRALGEAVGAAPSGLQALAQTLRQQQALGLAALALLLPIAFGLRQALARIHRR